MDGRVRDALEAELQVARELGFLGPGEVAAHLDHAAAYADAWWAVAAAGLAEAHPSSFADLGTGGGVPGLVLALAWPGSIGVLIDAGQRRVAFLRDAVRRLGVEDRIDVVEGRAEDVGTGPLRGRFDVVTARGFGPPAVTAECASPLLRIGGWMVVSEPPDSDGSRWEPPGLAELGLGEGRVVAGVARLFLAQAVSPCPARFPRRVGVPAKRPLF